MTIVISLLLLIAGGVGFLIFRQNQQQLPSKSSPKRLYSKSEVRIENVGPGGVLKLTGVGPDMEDFDVEVVSKHTYREGESTWYELEGDRGEDKVWIDIEEDDQLEISIVLRKLKLRDLNLNPNDLQRFDDREEGSFSFENDTFYYEDSDSAIFYRHSDDKDAERFYYWDFENEKGSKFISFEKWSDGSIDASLSHPIKLSQVTVYSIGGET